MIGDTPPDQYVYLYQLLLARYQITFVFKVLLGRFCGEQPFKGE